jgi:hypothetical protein
VYALSCLAGISQRPTARNPRSQKKVHAILTQMNLRVFELCCPADPSCFTIYAVHECEKWSCSSSQPRTENAALQSLRRRKACCAVGQPERCKVHCVQPRRHAVDEGWDGETNGYADEGGADGWDCQNGRPDPYARADRALQRAQADVAEQRERLEKVRFFCLAPLCAATGLCCICKSVQEPSWACPHRVLRDACNSFTCPVADDNSSLTQL